MTTRLNFNRTPLKIARTENNALAFQTLGDPIKDMFGRFGAMRNSSEQEIIVEFQRAFDYRPIDALKLLFFFRDPREGQKEKRVFDVVFKHWITTNDRLAYTLLQFTPEYGYWKQITNYMIFALSIDNTEFFDFGADLYGAQLARDKEGKNKSLAAKYALDENHKDKKAFLRFFNQVKGHLGVFSLREYRKTISALRKQLDVVEVKMSANEWNSINYGGVPSVAHKTYRKAFPRHDYAGYSQYMASVEKGEAKINAGVLTPVDIVHTYVNRRWNNFAFDQTLEAQWKAQEKISANVLVVSDVSGSMEMNSGQPMEVSVSLGIFFAQNSNGFYHNNLITFSNNPEYIELQDGWTLQKCIKEVHKANWDGSTNLVKTFDMILKAATSNRVPQEELPEWLIIISDMQFNEAVSKYDTPFEEINEKFVRAGYVMPKVIFWNVRASVKNAFPAPDSNGVRHLSGYSPTVFKLLLANINGDALQEVLSSPRYAFIDALF